MTIYSITKTPSRDTSLDWVAGILVLVAIFLHIDEWDGASVGFWHKFGAVFGFFMPWFFFKSGMFYKEADLKKNDYKIWKSLGVPFLTFSLVSWIVWLATAIYVHGRSNPMFVVSYSFFNVLHYGLLPGNGALYFIGSLWICRYIYPRLRRILHNNYLIAVLSLVIAYAFKCLDNFLLHRYLLLIIPTGFMGMAYYAMGVQWKEMQYRLPFFLVSAVIYVLAIIFHAQEISFYVAGVNDSNEIWIVYPFIAVASIMVWNNMARNIPAKILKRSIICYVGRNSMSYYCIHLIIIHLDFFFASYFDVTLFSLPLFWAYIVSCAIFLPVADIILRRYMPWAVGAKPRVRKGVEVGAASDPLP